MTNTWTPIPGAIVFDPEKGQRYVYHNGGWVPVPEWIEESSPLVDARDMLHRRIDKLADRIAALERAQREGQGEL